MHTTQTQYIDIRKNRNGRDRAFLAGTRVKVQDIVLLHERFGESAQEIAGSHFPQLSLAQVQAALTCFYEDPECIWNAIRDDRDFAMEMKRRQEAHQSS